MPPSSDDRLIRAFVAVRVDGEAASELARLQSSLAMRIPEGSLRLVDPRDFHLTLRFFGDLEEGEAQRVGERLSRLPESGRFVLRLGPLGVLPNARSARVVYGSVLEAERLASLAREIVLATRGIGHDEPARPFKAHATVARVRDPRRDGVLVGRAVRRTPAPKPVGWTVERVELMATDPLPGGPRYRTVLSLPLE